MFGVVSLYTQLCEQAALVVGFKSSLARLRIAMEEAAESEK